MLQMAFDARRRTRRRVQSRGRVSRLWAWLEYGAADAAVTRTGSVCPRDTRLQSDYFAIHQRIIPGCAGPPGPFPAWR